MLVEEIMHRNVHSVTPSTSIGDAIHLLKNHQIRHLPVLDGDVFVGLVTDRDLRSASPSSLDPKGLRNLLHRPVSEVIDSSGDHCPSSRLLRRCGPGPL